MRRYTLYIWVFVILLFFLIVSFSAVYFSLEGHKNDLMKEAVRERIHLAEIINETINSPFWVYRLALVPGMEPAFIRAMSQFPEIKYVRVVNFDGRIIESSQEGERGTLLKEPDIMKALDSKKSIVKDTTFGKEKIKLVIYPGYSNRTIWVGFTLNEASRVVQTMLLRDVIIFTVGSLIIFSVIFFFLRGKVVSPLKELTNLCQRVREGNLKARAKIKSRTEIGELAESFNRMVSDLASYQLALEKEKAALEIKVRERTQELEELAQKREELVEERTKELEEKVKQLEKFNRLVVGRELKMVALKKKIKRLEKKLEKCQS